ncbi:MAG: hypothetical protein KAS16_05215 [Thermoplasmata archaeon]|nr:hypothetical protein [Thermoplasmata archaeon]
MAFQENEIILFILGIGVLIFILKNHLDPKTSQVLMGFPGYNLFVYAYIIILIGWVFTILEGFFLNELLNMIEHMCYASSALMLAYWSWKVFGKQEVES